MKLDRVRIAGRSLILILEPIESQEFLHPILIKYRIAF